MQELEPTWQRALSVWWLLAWRGTVGAVLLMALVGAVFGFVDGVTGVSMASLRDVIVTLAVLVSLVWAILVVRMALRKQYGKFRIALVPR